jgi:hypothetical protein
VDETVSLIEHAVVGLIAEKSDDALTAIRSIDYQALVERRVAAYGVARERRGSAPAYRSPLPRARRQSTRRVDIRDTFQRDRFTCRYAHCRRPTVALEVLKLLSTAFPEVMPYHSNWRPVADHILYWTYSTSLEHAVPFPAGGTSAPQNLLTACYLCNDIKKHLPAELLGWRVGAPEQSTWMGLTEHLADLRHSVGHLVGRRTGG